MGPGWIRVCVFVFSLVFVVSVGMVVLAYSSYSLRWNGRPTVTGLTGTYTVDDLVGVAGLGSAVYVSGNYLNTSSNYNAIAIFEYSASDGGLVSWHGLYSSSGDLVNYGLAVNNNYVYVVGYYGNYAWIGALDTGLSSLEYQYYYPESGHSRVYYGVCYDGGGGVYAVGADWDLTGQSPVSYMLLTRFDDSLNPEFEATYYGSYNLTGYSCVVGPDGYLYAVAIDRWYYSGSYYPVALYILKLSPGDGSIAGQTQVVLYNSDGYVSSFTDVPAGIGSDGTYLYVAFTYSDSTGSSGSATAGASIMALDTDLNILWRYNVSTSYQERFYSIAVGREGDFAVGGSTNNPYGTDLSSSYFNAFLLVFNNQHSLSRAVLSGDTQGSHETLVYNVGLDGDGYVYWSGYAGDDDEYTAYYDVTDSVEVNMPSSVKSSLYGLKVRSIKLPTSVVAELSKAELAIHTFNKGVKAPPEGTVKDVRVVSAKQLPGILSTPGGGSSGIIVATRERVSPSASPPNPVPEGEWLVLMGVVVALVLSYLLWFRRRT